MSDFIRIMFSTTEQSAQAIRMDAAVLDDVYSHIHRASSSLYAGGLQGAFLDELQGRVEAVQTVLKQLHDEYVEAGNDLAIVVERWQQLDSEGAVAFGTTKNQASMTALPTTLDRQQLYEKWSAMREHEQEWIKELTAQLTGLSGGINRLLKLDSVYRVALRDAQERLNQIDRQLNRLEHQDVTLKDNLTTYTAQSVGFSYSELLNQGSNGSCTLYAAMNLLVQQGVDISPEEADAIFQEYSRKRGSKKGFPLEDAVEILSERYHTAIAVEYEDKSLSYNGQAYSDPTLPTQDLIRELHARRPVYVTARTDFVGDYSSGHAMVVNGVNIREDGSLDSVRVTTNWSTPEITIPADLFLEGWAARGYGMIRLTPN